MNFEKIEKAVVEGYQKIENGVVEGYKKIEEGAVEEAKAPLIPLCAKYLQFKGLSSVTALVCLMYNHLT